MFCPNCGSQIEGTERFCAKCGSALEQQAAPKAAGSFDGQAFVNKLLGKSGDYRPMMTAILALCGLVQAILWFCPVLAVNGFGSMSFSMHYLYEKSETVLISILIFIGLLAVLALSVLRLFDVKVGKLNLPVWQKVSAIEASVLTCTILFEKLAQGNDSIVLTFGGVLYIIMSVAVVGVAVYLHLLDKKAE